jgi:hypothetical protein
VTRPTGDDGSAVLEFVYLAILVMVPLVYLLLTVFQVQSAAFGATEAARQAGRAYVTADTTAEATARAQLAAETAMADQGLTDAPPPVVACAPLPPTDCLQPGARVEVTVTYDVELRFLGGLFTGTQGPRIPVTATHVQHVDRARAPR